MKWFSVICLSLSVTLCACRANTPVEVKPNIAVKQTEAVSPGMVAAANPHAVEAGLEILRAGGSAVDAAIAVQTVLGLVEPQSSGIAGGAFMIVYDNKTGDVWFYNGREKAPAGVTPDMFLDPETGEVYWSFEMEPAYEMSIIAPVQHGDFLLASALQGTYIMITVAIMSNHGSCLAKECNSIAKVPCSINKSSSLGSL